MAPAAHRRRDVRCAGLAERIEQIANDARCRGAAVDQQRWSLKKGLSEATPFGATSRHGDHDAFDHDLVERGSSCLDETDNDAERICQHGGCRSGHRLALGPSDAGACRPQGADPGLGTAGALRLSSRLVRRNRFDQVLQRALQDVAQGHEDLEAQTLWSVHDKAVDLARGKLDASSLECGDQIGGGEHVTAGHHLAQVPAVVEFGAHYGSLPSLLSNAKARALRSAVFMKSELTWV
jgi:hypothetical protein